MSEAVQVEATGETVGEAKWSALRELEKLQPGIDKAAVRFQVLSEGERGLLGVGYAPARVIASVESNALVEAAEPPQEETELGGQVREIVQRILEAIGVRANLEIREDDESVVALLVGRELGLVIGKHGQTIDAIQYLVITFISTTVSARSRWSSDSRDPSWMSGPAGARLGSRSPWRCRSGRSRCSSRAGASARSSSAGRVSCRTRGSSVAAPRSSLWTTGALRWQKRSRARPWRRNGACR